MRRYRWTDRQIPLPVSIFASLPEESRLRAAYERCHGMRRRQPFEEAIRTPAVAKCLAAFARAIERAEEEGRTFGPSGRR